MRGGELNTHTEEIKAGLIWCGVNRLGDSGVHTLGDTSAFVNPAGQLLLKGHCIAFKYYADGIKFGLTPPG